MKLSRWLCSLLILIVVASTPLELGAIDFPSFGWGSDKKEKEKGKNAEGESEDEEAGEFDTKVTTPLIAEYVQIAGLNMITLHGVGLVTGLNGTGGDPPPSMYRTALLEDMRKKSVKNPNELLRSPNNALVVIKAYLPPLARKGEEFDIEVYAPDGSNVKSLNGGWLLPVNLAEQALVPGRGMLEGHVYAKAEGPVLVSMTAESGEESAGVLRRGRVVAGGRSLKERNLTMYLRNDFRSYRNSKRVAEAIGKRFYEYDSAGQNKPLAEAKTDQQIQLKVQSKYRDNFPRYLQVIRNIAFREEPTARRVRIRKLKGELLEPATAEDASLKLEAIGDEAIPVLKAGLQSKSLEVRFHSALALAYMGHQDGLADLAKAVREEPAFRVFGLAGLASIDVAETHVLLRQLLNEQSAETRYGAFRALTTLDKNDPFIRGERLNDQFNLHVLDTEGPPMVHLTNRRKSEVVLFGADQKFKTPFSARAGLHILVNAPAGSETVTVSRFEVGRPDQRRTVSTRVADVIHAVTEMDASYPDVAMLLAQAGATHNLPGRVEIDALPQAGRTYMRPESDIAGTSSSSKARIGSTHLVPNLFSANTAGNTKGRSQPQADDLINQVAAEEDADQSDDKAAKDGKPSRTRKATLDNDVNDNKKIEPAGGILKQDGRSSAEVEDDETEKREPARRSWNLFSYFRSRGQKEPVLDDADLARFNKPKTAGAATEATGNATPPAQSEP